MSAQTPATQYLSLGPGAMIVENDRERRARADCDAALWTFDDAAAAIMAVHSDVPAPAFPTVVQFLEVEMHCEDQDRYTERFERSFPGVAAVVARLGNVHVAGDAASWPLAYEFGSAVPPSTVTLYIVGVPEDPWAKLREVRAQLRASLAGNWAEAITPGAFMMWLQRSATPRGFFDLAKEKLYDPTRTTFRIILRPFASISAVLHEFGVFSAAVAFDGKVARMTRAAAWANAHMLNVVNPAYRDASYEDQLVCHFKYGYGIGLPGMDPGALVVGAAVRLPHIRIEVREVNYGIHAEGEVLHIAAKKPVPPPLSIIRCHDEDGLALYNIRQAVLLKNRFFCAIDSDAAFEAFVAAPPTFDGILPVAVTTKALDAATVMAITPGGEVYSKVLRHVFQMSDAGIERLQRFIDENPATRISDSLAPSRMAVLRALCDAPREIPWWILDPDSVSAVSTASREEDTAAWYGRYAVAAP